MKRLITLTVVGLLSAAGLAFAADAASDSWQRDLLAWREKRAANLQAPEGWLSLIGLEWLKEGDNSVGSAADNKIQIAKAPPHLGIVRLAKDGKMQLLAPAGGFPKELQVEGHPAQEQPLLADDQPNPSK